MGVFDAVEYKLAEKSIKDYADAVMDEHRAVMALHACEDHLAMGMKAFERVRRVEDTFRTAAGEGVVEYSHEFSSAIEALYRAWLKPCEDAERFAKSLETQGHRPNNLNDFLQCRERAEERLRRLEWERIGREAAESRFAEEPW